MFMTKYKNDLVGLKPIIFQIKTANFKSYGFKTNFNIKRLGVIKTFGFNLFSVYSKKIDKLCRLQTASLESD